MTNNLNNDTLLTPRQTAEMISKSVAWLARKRCEGGGIPYKKIGRHVRYQRSTVSEWLNKWPEQTSTSAQIAIDCNSPEPLGCER